MFIFDSETVLVNYFFICCRRKIIYRIDKAYANFKTQLIK